MPNSVWRESLSRSILDLVEDKANIGSWSWDLASGDLNWSVGVYRIFALSPDEAPGLPLIANSMQGSDAATLRSTNPLIIARFLADRKFTIRRRDGELRTVHSHGKLLTSAHNGETQFVGAFLDITDSQVQDELFLLREALLDSIRQLFGVAIWQTDARGGVTDPMQWGMAIGTNSKPEASWARLQMVHPDDEHAVSEAWAQALDNRRTYFCEFRTMVGGNPVSAQSQAVPLLDGAGDILGWIGFTRVLDSFPLETAPSRSAALFPGQIRAARGALNWSGRELAEKAKVSFSSVRRAESDISHPVSTATFAAIKAAFEHAGVSFVGSEGALGLVVQRKER